ncbi:hypothetical protein CWI37_2097p0010 [Hamiltosporidium tvaerminnensis]|uniref:Uncharacterized protein n=2 Tax=Hamiltosporidium TaxID=1176354 RepID=A0A4Q9LD72_9MICR|nr:hypothetical protein CWI37_2097p0010 [Hamiltosporidium tvaerminnensis]TBU05794.1 hypothetical protein CWI39_0620p0020 [Hamiltosporidium magnivora]
MNNLKIIFSAVLFIFFQLGDCEQEYKKGEKISNMIPSLVYNIDSRIFISIKPRSKVENTILTNIFFKFRKECLDYVLNKIKIEEVRYLVRKEIQSNNVDPKSYNLEFQLYIFVRNIQRIALDLFFNFYSKHNTILENDEIKIIRENTEAYLNKNYILCTIDQIYNSLRNENISKIYSRSKNISFKRLFCYNTNQDQLITEILIDHSKLIIENIISCAFVRISLGYEDLFEMLKALKLTDIPHFKYFKPYKKNENYAINLSNKNGYISIIKKRGLDVCGGFSTQNADVFPFFKVERKRKHEGRKSINPLFQNDRESFLNPINQSSVFYEENNVLRIEKLEFAYDTLKSVLTNLNKFKESKPNLGKTLIIIDLDLRHFLTDILLNYFIMDGNILNIVLNNEAMEKPHEKTCENIQIYLLKECNKHIPKLPPNKRTKYIENHYVIQIRPLKFSAKKIRKIVSGFIGLRKIESRLRCFIDSNKRCFYTLIYKLINYMNKTIEQHLLSI